MRQQDLVHLLVHLFASFPHLFANFGELLLALAIDDLGIGQAHLLDDLAQSAFDVAQGALLPRMDEEDGVALS